MTALNIFRLIGDFFQWAFSVTFDKIRLSGSDWWTTNAVNWFFLFVLLVLFAYWMKESVKFLKEGTED